MCCGDSTSTSKPGPPAAVSDLVFFSLAALEESATIRVPGYAEAVSSRAQLAGDEVIVSSIWLASCKVAYPPLQPNVR